MNDTIKNIKRIFVTLLMLPVWGFGQTDLCHECAISIIDANNLGKCCEECMRDYYVRQLQSGRRHGNLSQYCNYDLWKKMIPFPDTLTSHFLVTGINQQRGYCLKSSELVENTFYMINLECKDTTIVQAGTPIVLIVNDSSFFKKGEYYDLSLHPYFKKNQYFIIREGKTCEVIHSNHTMFDLVYKDWLIVKIPTGHNYFFML